MKIYIGSDHAGFELKERLQKWLKENASYEVVDLGAFNADPTDYPVIAREVAEKVQDNAGSFGVLICGSGEGVCMVANKAKGVRAALADTPERAKTSREHNNANVVCLGARFTDESISKQIVETFLTTEFSGEERHVKRVGLMES